MVYPVEVLFAPRKSTNVIEVGSSYNIKNSTPSVPQKAAKILSEEEKIKLDKGLFVVFRNPSNGHQRKKRKKKKPK